MAVIGEDEEDESGVVGDRGGDEVEVAAEEDNEEVIVFSKGLKKKEGLYLMI